MRDAADRALRFLVDCVMLVIAQTQVSSRERDAVQPGTRVRRFAQARPFLVFPALVE